MMLSLSFMIFAFNWTSYEVKPILDDTIETETLQDIEVTRTPRENPPEPPPAVVEPTNVIEPLDQPEFDPEPVVEPLTEKPLESIITTPTPAPVVAKPKPAPRPAPPVVEEPELNIPEIFTVVEEMPRFPGCETEGMSKKEKKRCAEKALMQFLGKNIRYPELAKEGRIEGTVVMNFVVNEDGSISDINVMRDIGGGCAREAARVIKKMPKWIPGKQIGRPVKVRFNIPIKYKLE